MTLRTITTVFPGGWRYNQMDANGKLLKAFRSMNEYKAFVAQVTQFRVLNKLSGATPEEVNADIQQFLCEQVGGDPRLCEGGSKKNFWSSLSRSPGAAVGRVANAVKAVASGTRVLRDWLGSGLKPVSQATAQSRADVCTRGVRGGSCPHNSEDADLAAVTGPIAGFIHEQMEKKAQLKLAVKGESDLHHCKICLCDLKLKIWTPMQTILNRTENEMRDKFRQQAPPNCWMLEQLK